MTPLPACGDAARGEYQHSPAKDKAMEDPFPAPEHASRQSTASAQCTWSGGVGTPAPADALVHEARRDLPHAPSVRLCEVAATLKDGDRAGRESALEVLKEIAVKEGPVLITAVAEYAKDESPWVRQAFVDALAHAAKANQADAAAVLLPRLGDGSPAVRNSALRALAQLPSKGLDPALFTGLVDWLEREDDSTIREALVAAVALTFEVGNAVAIAALLTLSKDCSCWVRLGAVTGLGQVAKGSADEAVLLAFAARSADGSWQVREAASAALGRLAWGRWAGAALRVAAGLQWDRSPRVREAASAAVEAIAKEAGRKQKLEKHSAQEPAPPQEAGDGHFNTAYGMDDWRSQITQQIGQGSKAMIEITGLVAATTLAAVMVIWMRRQ